MEYLNSPRQQQGVVLVAALIMIVAVTGIAVTLMSSSTIDLKMTNAAQERETAEHVLAGGVEDTIATEVNKQKDSTFLWSQGKFASQTTVDQVPLTNAALTSAMLENRNTGPSELNCPRRYNYTAGIKCNMLRLNATLEYGAKTTHTIGMASGIAQEMLELNTNQ